jgi:hypothetical protein
MGLTDRFFSLLISLSIRDFVKKIVRYRYFIVLVLFVVLVLCKVNYSSIGTWKEIIPSSYSKTEIVGNARGIRGDESLTQTPFYLAQAYSGTPYSVVNSNISISGQNMIVSYGAPVWDISTLSKPLNWGFLLFGPSYGLAWYWNLKILLMILLSYELCMILTRRNMLISILGSFWVVYSPAVQWWFMQHVGDSIFYMEAIVVVFYYFLLNFDRFWLKITFALLFGLACVGYALTLYPAIQIPLAYLALLLIILIFIDFRKKIKFKITDGIIIGCTLLFIVLMLLHVYLISKGAIMAILHTSYPGSRISAGGEGQPYAFNAFLTNLFLPVKDVPATISNNCEISAFYNFLPAVLFILPFMIKKKAGNLKFGIALSIFSVLAIVYLYVNIPAFLAKITLLSYVTYRIEIAYGISAVYLSIWALSEITRTKFVGKIYSAVASCMIALSYFITIEYTPLKGYVRLRYYLAFILVLLLLNYFLLQGKKWLFAIVMFSVIIVSGAMVNPINIGLGDIYHNDLTPEVQSIRSSNPKASWIALNSNAMGAFLYSNGVKDLDGTNYYPDMQKWKLLDPNGKYKDIYNRYAHIVFNLTKDATTFSTPSPDCLTVNLNVNDLKKLKVTYLLTTGKLEQFDNSSVEFENMTADPVNGYYVYQVIYQ